MNKVTVLNFGFLFILLALLGIVVWRNFGGGHQLVYALAMIAAPLSIWGLIYWALREPPKSNKEEKTVNLDEWRDKKK